MKIIKTQSYIEKYSSVRMPDINPDEMIQFIINIGYVERPNQKGEEGHRFFIHTETGHTINGSSHGMENRVFAEQLLKKVGVNKGLFIKLWQNKKFRKQPLPFLMEKGWRPLQRNVS